MVSEKRKKYLDNYVETRKRVNISLSIADFKKVEYLASVEKLKPTPFVTQVIQKHLEKSPYLSQQLQNEIKEIKFLLRNIANNVNQISHRSNILKVMVEEQELLRELQKLEEGIAHYLVKGSKP